MAVVPSSLIFYPFAYTLFDDVIRDYCWYCLKERDDNISSAKQCSGCKTAVFCNNHCRSLGWFDHKPECFAIRKADGKVPKLDVRMLARIVWRYKKSDRSTKPEFWLNRSSRRSIMEICDHCDEFRTDPTEMTKFKNIYDCLTTLYDSKYLCDEETTFQLHCRNFVNRHSINDSSYLKEIGKGLYLDLCAYDHSCAPNSIYVCQGFIATLKPLNDSVNLEDRQTTFYTYISLLTAKQMRQKLLADTWFFKCQCKRCTSRDDDLLTSVICKNCNEAVPIFFENGTPHDVRCSCKTIINEKEASDALCLMRSIDFMLDDYRSLNERFGDDSRLIRKFLLGLLSEARLTLHESNVYFVKILQALITYWDQNDAEKLLEFHLRANQCVNLCFPNNHPALAYHFMNIGLLHSKLNQRDGLIWLKMAKDSFSYVLGSDHIMTMRCIRFIDQLEANNTLLSK